MTPQDEKKLVPEWRSVWRKWSVQLTAILTLVAGYGPLFLEQWRDLLPDWWLQALTAVVGTAAIGVSVLKQKSVTKKRDAAVARRDAKAAVETLREDAQ